MTFKSFVRHIENKPQEIPKAKPKPKKKKFMFEISVDEYIRSLEVSNHADYIRLQTPLLGDQ